MYKFIINDRYKKDLESFILKLPIEFASSGNLIHDFRNKLKVFVINAIEVNVKWFKIPNIINQIAYSLFRKSKAERSYRYALELIERGINTPTPIAYLENRYFILFKESAYVSEQENFDGALQLLRTGSLEDHRELIIQFAIFTAELHNKKILHLDYSSGNILFKKDGTNYIFYLVDLNRMIFDKSIDLKMAAHNFRRLWGSDSMIELFVSKYAEVRGFNIEQTINLVKHDRKLFWIQFGRKYPGEKPYHP